MPASPALPLTTLSLPYTGEFDLRQSARSAGRAVFVDPDAAADGHLDLAFALEGSWAPVTARITQADDGALHAALHANPQAAGDDDIRGQLIRMLSLAPDGRAFADLVAGDPVLAAMAAGSPGLRPIAYPSAYEAAAHAIIGHRLAVPAAAAAFSRLARSDGTALELDGREVHAFPEPARLAELTDARGISERKIAQLRTLGRVAADDRALLSGNLLNPDRDDAMALLQRLPGIGPFSAELVMIRGCADPDVFPRPEGRLHRAMAEAYDLGADPDVATLERVATRWRPFRSWVGLIARDAAKDRSTGSATTAGAGR